MEAQLANQGLLAKKVIRAPGSALSQTDSVGAGAHVRECFHCLEPVPNYCNLTAELDGRSELMCCIGCKAAAEFINQRGLMRFYTHRARFDRLDFFSEVANEIYQPKLDQRFSSSWQFLDSDETAAPYVIHGEKGLRSLNILVEGLYCSSCTWLIGRALHGVSEDLVFQADIDARSIRICVSDPNLQLSTAVETIARLGYRPTVCIIGDIDAASTFAKNQRRQAITRIAVAGFGMMQVMTYATAGYFGGSFDSGNTSISELMNPSQERFFLLLSMLVATVVVFYSGLPFFRNAVNDIRNRHLGMDVPIAFAIAGAYFPSTYQVFTHTSSHVYFDSAVMFVFFLSIGRFVEMTARHKLIGRNVDVQSLLPKEILVSRRQSRMTSPISIKPNEVVIADRMKLERNAIVPFDAMIRVGSGDLDESQISGEALSVTRSQGDVVLAGSVLISGTLEVESTGDWSDSSIAKIQNSIDAAERSNDIEHRRRGRFSSYFILAILGLTIIASITWFLIAPERVFEVCLAILIASCPCAFALAEPIGRSAAIHSLKRVGVLLTTNVALESVLKVSRWCFDKTGTLTRGQPSISKVAAHGALSTDACLQIVACIEKHSDHVLSIAFKHIQTDLQAEGLDEIIGQGVSATVGGQRYHVGKRSWICQQLEGDQKYKYEKKLSSNIEIVFANDHEILAEIQITDQPRVSAKPFINRLRGLTRDSTRNVIEGSTQLRANHAVELTALSGDHEVSVSALCAKLGITDFRSGLSPSQKLDRIKGYQDQGEVVAMVGDGVNDAPVLAAADVSIAMSHGSQLALNNADVVLLNGNLENLNVLSNVAKRAQEITHQNLVWALGYNAIAIPLAAFGLLTPWIAALGMSASSALVVLNALRIQNQVKPSLQLVASENEARG